MNVSSTSTSDSINIWRTWALTVTYEAGEYTKQKFKAEKTGGDPVIPSPNLDTDLVMHIKIPFRCRWILQDIYLPDTLTDTTQKEIREATNLLAPSLKKSVRADGNWRTNHKWFNRGLEDVGATPGCINLSPAWFQQGHENVSDLEVSASLKGPSCENILKAIARPAAIVSAA
ncbi:uncharacterized protein HD556DRAFT_1443187 [Suillus plorans]|uniref:Uncharacterized protein n=1 Tax=Suillus plorans TaxID=116603 RepID=A0A9P7AQD0_9AGAM|nr:uncharacterized protein HD556DRAFT_1443187 [Suillus plorans]KAG1794241.1 hypothetical protein HD556DRAFT_1443187 [Suillus plorans]